MHELVLIAQMLTVLLSIRSSVVVLKLKKCGSILLNASASPVRHSLYFHFECVLRKKWCN